MIILFGSYARGDFIEYDSNEDEASYYESDFDILAITRNEKSANDVVLKKNY